MSALVIAEHNNLFLNAATLHTITAAVQCGGDVDVLIAGNAADAVATEASKIVGVHKVIHIDASDLGDQLAEPLAAQILAIANQYSHILAPATASGKNVMPRVAAKLDVAQISDITKIVSSDTFERPIYAGNAIATVQSIDPIKVITVRTTSFDPVRVSGGSAEITKLAPVSSPGKSDFISRDLNQSERPELAGAKIIVSGGRGLGSGEAYQELVLPLADKLGAALGASRAAVDLSLIHI